MVFARVALAAVLLSASPALAQKVIVLELDGDAGNRLRAQIESALRRGAAVEVLSLEKYKENAAKKKLNGGAAMTPVGVSRTAKLMKIDAAVAGEVTATTYKVVIYDALGAELWTKSLPVKRGLLTDDFAVKLSRAIAAAAEQGAARANVTPGGGDESGSTSSNAEPTMVLPPPKSKVIETDADGIDLTAAQPPPRDTRESVRDDLARDTDLDTEGQRTDSDTAPPIFRAWVAGTTTWRAQCLRPGPATMKSCKDYDSITPKPLGIQIDFTASVPYLGVMANVELFPLATLHNRFAQGFGVLGQIAYGASVTKIVEASDQGTSPEKRINSTDISWVAQLAWRFHFTTGLGKPQPVSYIGVRGGLQARSFNIDPNAGVSLPSSQRTLFGAVGLDASVSIVKQLRVEATFAYFISPAVGPDQIQGYGNANDGTGGVQSSGYGFEAGLAGEIYGPLGYQVRVRHQGFHDQYYGQGTKWQVCNDAQCGGIAEESYTSLLWGLTASF